MKIPMANQNFGSFLNLFELRLLQTKMHASNINRYLCTSSSSKITEHDLMKILQNILMMTSGNFAQATIVFYIFISKMILLCFCINSAKKHKRLPNAKLIRQRLNVMITLPERRLIDYENLE